MDERIENKRITIEESGMIFGSFPVENVFYIEKSKAYQKMCSAGVKTVEFILLHSKKGLFFIEAKSSSSQKDIDFFIEEIAEKFKHSFELWMSIYERRNAADISEKFLQVDMGAVPLKYVLVINGHEEKWLEPIMVELNKALLPYKKIWGLNIAVMNEEIAKSEKLIC